MIIASIFAFFYFCLCPDARNHRQSILDSPPFFMCLRFAVFLICAGLSLPEFQPYFVPHNTIQCILYLAVKRWKCVFTVNRVQCSVYNTCCIVGEQFSLSSCDGSKHFVVH